MGDVDSRRRRLRAATLDALRNVGCGLAQGFHIGRPGPPERIAHATPMIG